MTCYLYPGWQIGVLQMWCRSASARLLTALSAPQSDEIEKMKMELLRVRFDEQMRGEKAHVLVSPPGLWNRAEALLKVQFSFRVRAGVPEQLV